VNTAGAAGCPAESDAQTASGAPVPGVAIGESFWMR